jgi:hypothetical protein
VKGAFGERCRAAGGSDPPWRESFLLALCPLPGIPSRGSEFLKSGADMCLLLFNLTELSLRKLNANGQVICLKKINFGCDFLLGDGFTKYSVLRGISEDPAPAGSVYPD